VVGRQRKREGGREAEKERETETEKERKRKRKKERAERDRKKEKEKERKDVHTNRPKVFFCHARKVPCLDRFLSNHAYIASIVDTEDASQHTLGRLRERKKERKKEKRG
jgi:hypothetical protein